MTRRLTFELDAIDSAARFLADDAESLRGVLAAVDSLTEEPAPVGSLNFGSPDLRRLRIDRY